MHESTTYPIVTQVVIDIPSALKSRDSLYRGSMSRTENELRKNIFSRIHITIMQRLQAYKLELVPDGAQERHMRRLRARVALPSTRR
jgi:hypothetical protein